jgi:hypothetical protein
MGTLALDNAWDLAECKRVESAHCPAVATPEGTGGERHLLWAYHPPCFMRARLVTCISGVLELELTKHLPKRCHAMTPEPRHYWVDGIALSLIGSL